MLDLGSIAVPIVLSLVFSAVLSLILFVVALRRVAIPTLIATFEEKYAAADAAISRGYKAMGLKSGQVRELKALEKAVLGDMLEQYPEINMILETFSPDTAAMMADNPQMAAILVERYLPLAQKLFPQIFQARESITQIRQEYEF